MLVFGGKNEENEKMNDLWKFDLTAKTWTKLEVEDKTTIPQIRSGHSAVMAGDYMMVFGGIFEITKELNDAHLYDIKNNKWMMFFAKKAPQPNTGVTASPTKS